jgi:hypothetical protein
VPATPAPAVSSGPSGGKLVVWGLVGLAVIRTIIAVVK